MNKPQIKNLICIKDVNNYNSALLMNDAFCLFCVYSGMVQLTLLDKSYDISSGKAVLIFPNQPHAFLSYDTSQAKLVTFSASLLPDFSMLVSGKEANEPVFDLDSCADYVEDLSEEDDLFLIKSNLYYIVSSYMSRTRLIETNDKTSAFISAVTKYIADNYRYDITLRTLAEHLRYDYNYTSRLLQRNLKCTFSVLVNQYRIERAAAILIANPERTILDIALDCGYSSLRSFNRNFLAVKAITPSDFRHGQH